MRFLLKFENFINIYTLGAVLLAIVVITELSGSAFFESGAIHFIGIIFAAFALYRVFMPHPFFDYFLSKFVKVCLIVLLFLSAAHILEYLIMQAILQYPVSVIETAVLNLYVVSALFIIAAAEYVFTGYHRKHKVWLWAAVFLAAASVLVFLVILFRGRIESDVLPLTLLIALFVFGSIAAYRVFCLKKLLPLFKSFSNYVAWGVILLIAAGILEFFEVVNVFELPMLQVVYNAYFLLYAALVLFIASFGTFYVLPGLYADIKEIIEKGEITLKYERRITYSKS